MGLFLSCVLATVWPGALVSQAKVPMLSWGDILLELGIGLFAAVRYVQGAGRYLASARKVHLLCEVRHLLGRPRAGGPNFCFLLIRCLKSLCAEFGCYGRFGLSSRAPSYHCFPA